MIESETYGIWQKTILVAKKKISVESMETLRNRLSVIWQCVEDLDGGGKVGSSGLAGFVKKIREEKGKKNPG